MFLSIVDDSYSQVSDDKSLQNRLKLTKFLGVGFGNVMKCCKCAQAQSDDNEDFTTKFEDSEVDDAAISAKLDKIRNIFRAYG